MLKYSIKATDCNPGVITDYLFMLSGIDVALSRANYRVQAITTSTYSGLNINVAYQVKEDLVAYLIADANPSRDLSIQFSVPSSDVAEQIADALAEQLNLKDHQLTKLA